MTDQIKEALARLTADCNDGRQLGRMVVTSRNDLRALIKHLDAQAALIAEAGRVVEPFAEAAANLGSYNLDRDDLWESPEAAMLTVGDLRLVAAFSDKLKRRMAGRAALSGDQKP